MFGNIFNAAIKAVKNFIAPKKAAPKPKPAPVSKQKANTMIRPIKITPVSSFAKFKAPPKVNFYIANWGDSPATISRGMAANKKQMSGHNAWYKKQQAEVARAKAEKEKRIAQAKFDKIKGQYITKAQHGVAGAKKAQDGDFWSWVTGGFTRDNAARDFAQKQLDDLEKNQVPRYDKKLNTFLKEQTKRAADLKKKQTTMSAADYNKAIGLFAKWESQQIDSLEYMRAASAGLSYGYKQGAEAEGTSAIAKIAGWFGKSVVEPVAANPIFKYTLGQGDENVPSLVTAPSRGVNWLANQTINKDGNKNLFNGRSVKGFEKGKNAWTQTFNQRNLNMSQPGKSSDQDFETWYKTRKKQNWDGQDPKKVKEMYRRAYESQIQGNAMANNVTEFFADPLTLLSGGSTKIGKGVSWVAKAAKDTKVGTSIFDAGVKIAESKAVKWLGKEYKTPEKQFSDAYAQSKKDVDQIHRELAPRINAINQRLAGKSPIDLSILDDLKKLSDREAAIIQRMVNGKLSFKDRVALTDVKGLRGGMTAQRERLIEIANRWTDFAEKMKMSDAVEKTRFGKGKGFYSPRVDYTGEHRLENYDFLRRKTRSTKKQPQKAEDLGRNATDRYFKSNLGADLNAGAAADRAKWLARRSELQGEYNARFARVTAPVRDADAKRGTVSRYVKQRATGQKPTTKIGRSIFNSGRNVVGMPTRLWKKSVLTYRPAWTVNNVLYNTQAAGLAGGSRAIVEQAKMLRPKNWRKAMNEVPDAVKTDLTGELGGAYSGRNPLKKLDSKMNKFYGGVENWSRVAAFRGAKAKGLTDEQALKRVDKYMFNYKTKNWERPLKAVMPFWAWSKNLTKASVNMPLDRPLAAKAYHEVDQYQQGQFDAEFKKVENKLVKLGYTPQEIDEIREQQAKYFRGRLKVGNNWINTPFNAFSEKGLGGIGFNPFLTATAESSRAVDSFGQKIGGKDAHFINRVLTKFPQVDLARKQYAASQVAKGNVKPIKGWIGEKGSSGYGLSKEMQGYDPSKKNYVAKLDPRAKTTQDALAFLGVPRSMQFDKNKLIETKTLEKVADSYFDLDTSEMEFDEAEKARQAIFKKYGITADQFYGGLLSKYDTKNTTRIKALKQAGASANKKLFAEYAKQPEGTRNIWASKKLKELNAQNYFADNPFKKGFSWVNRDTIAKADKQEIVIDALKTGDWSKYRQKYGTTVSQKFTDYTKAKQSGDWSAYEARYGRSQKALDRDYAVKTGDWSLYVEKYGVSKTTTPHRFAGKFFKSAESMDRYKQGLFWKKYADASKSERRTLLAANPEFNKRADWSNEKWDLWKETKKKNETKRARAWGTFAQKQDAHLAANKRAAAPIFAKQNKARASRLTWVSRV